MNEPGSAFLIVLAAFIADLLFGDPRWLPHPVKGIGWLIQRTGSLLRKSAKTPVAEKAAGVFLVILIVLPVYALSSLILSTAFSLSWYFGMAFSVLMAYTALAARGLADAAGTVLARLDAGDLAGARKELSLIVGRDTEKLDEPEIVRAVVETVAENVSDGVAAPLFYLAIGGPALAMAYKAVNTLDSMVGYKNEKYINFGWAAAKLDDIANYVPARITAALICLAADVVRWSQACFPISKFVLIRDNSRLKSIHSKIRTPHSAFSSSWKIMLRDGGNHPSPNSGWPEAAMAGALGTRLGGPSSYSGEISRKPFIGEELRVPCKKDIAMSVGLLYCSSLPAALAAALGAAVLKTW